MLIQSLGSISGAHFNPVVSLLEFLWGRLKAPEFFGYLISQFTGAIAGVWITHIMFSQEVLQVSLKARFGVGLWISEVVATFGLICTIALAGRKHVEFAPFSVAAYITAAYWFTSSTSFANPAVTLARVLTNTFCGISPPGVVPYMCAQLFGALIAFVILKNIPQRTS